MAKDYKTVLSNAKDEFVEKRLYSENYIKVQNHIMQTLKRGGIILIVAGSKGLTPQRIYGYILEETECCKCPESLIRILRKI